MSIYAQQVFNTAPARTLHSKGSWQVSTHLSISSRVGCLGTHHVDASWTASHCGYGEMNHVWWQTWCHFVHRNMSFPWWQIKNCQQHYKSVDLSQSRRICHTWHTILILPTPLYTCCSNKHVTIRLHAVTDCNEFHTLTNQEMDDRTLRPLPPLVR